MSATANSMARPTDGGMTTLNTMISDADDDHRDRVTEPPQRTDQGRVRESPAAVQDRGDRDDVVGIGRVAHAEQEAEACQREQLGHRGLQGGWLLQDVAIAGS